MSSMAYRDLPPHHEKAQGRRLTAGRGSEIRMTDLALDYLGLDALLSPGELAWRDTVRAFVRDRITPNIKTWYEQAVFPAELVPEMGRLGLLGVHRSGYRCPGRSVDEYGLDALELEAGDSGLRPFVRVEEA